MSKSPRLALATAVLVALAGLSQANAADIIPVITDPAGVGYNDPTPVAPVGGNPGTTRGEQRRIVANYAASLWGSVLQSNVPIYVQARFLPLAQNVLGSAGATYVNSNFANAPFANTWYHTALADSISGTDLVPDQFDITSQFSTNFTFYYGLDGNTPANQTNFLDVVMHEYAHGLGFSNFENEAAGTFFQGVPDVYSQFTYDNTAAKYWTAMTVAERIASGVNNGNVVFTGPRAVAGAQLLLDNRLYLRVSAPAGIAADYAYGTASFGPAAGPSNFAGQAVVATDGVGTPGDGCEAITSNVMGKIAIIDRGTCGFTIKVKNAQLAGATAVIIADNQPGAVAGMSGTDQTITIPSVRVTQASGNLFKSNVPVTVSMVEDPVLLQGADDLGRPRLFMPNPVQSGSSGSHYDSVATPNLLMEPAINSSLRSYYNLDITPALMADIGWKLNTGNAKIGSPRVPDCDTGIKAVTEGGLIAGGTVQANNDMCLLSAQTRWGYYSCMQAGRDRMLAVGLITSTQASKMMTCARRVADNTNFPLTSN
jgi:PA domain